MVETTLRRAVSGARLVEFHEHRDVFVVWSGGITFNVYSDVGEELHEVDVFSVSNELGEPVDPETAREHITDYLEREFGNPTDSDSESSDGVSREDAMNDTMEQKFG